MSAVEHGFKLRAPWYVCERGGYDRFSPAAERPAVQKYDTAEYVQRLLADPRDSLTFDAAEDVWSYPVAVPAARRGAGRLRFATHQLVRTELRKLYQPSHDRFYAVAVELFCDRPGLPRPSPADELEVGLVMRRLTMRVTARPLVVRRLARQLTARLLAAQSAGAKPESLRESDVDDVVWADAAHRLSLDPGDTYWRDRLGLTEVVEGWVVGPTGRGRWQPVGPDGAPEDQVLPMWRLPNPGQKCAAAATRSLWFGPVPTFSGEHDADGAPKLDEEAVYQLRCFVRRKSAPGDGRCPPQVSWSAPTEPFRLAAFFDPQGSKNRQVSVRLPDFRTLAARAGQPPGPGGAVVTSPPQSQLSFDPGGGIPSGGSVGGTSPRVCTFAIELLTIVAFFVFSLFLPVVVFLFQLWWLLALRFCLPPAAAAMALLKAYFAGGGTLADLPPTAPGPPAPPSADRTMLDALLGAPGASARLAAADSKFPAADAAELPAALDPTTAARPAEPPVECSPPDPLCGGGR
ncbi:hypothetical protein [Saccharothrix sp. ST-888]|uniref:hypothetical protein n=1 Tax=Saccharothrix sp. ST-888 TaxID=1427391 RepID=UPI0005ECFE41|nr:hypothetical protein [Saccharothrix sp. ST-888]KJK59275.1 hypothetical protein UK12_05480 [Saccharothrix sp. ST-888]